MTPADIPACLVVIVVALLALGEFIRNLRA